MPVGAPRTRTINLRTDENRRALIDLAAAAVGKDRTQFMLEAATREARSVLIDRRYFDLDRVRYEQFVAALDAPPLENPALRRLMGRRAPWER